MVFYFSSGTFKLFMYGFNVPRTDDPRKRSMRILQSMKDSGKEQMVREEPMRVIPFFGMVDATNFGYPYGC